MLVNVSKPFLQHWSFPLTNGSSLSWMLKYHILHKLSTLEHSLKEPYLLAMTSLRDLSYHCNAKNYPWIQIIENYTDYNKFCSKSKFYNIYVAKYTIYIKSTKHYPLYLETGTFSAILGHFKKSSTDTCERNKSILFQLFNYILYLKVAYHFIFTFFLVYKF